jgi:hypothetical protein
MAYTTINYDEGNRKNLNYKSVEIQYGRGKDEKKKIFNTGKFVKDWFDLKKFQIIELSGIESYFVHSSTVNDFIMDGAPYDSAYLHTKGNESILKYFDRTDPKWYLDVDGIGEGIEFFVPEGTQPTWEELKEMCK